MGAGVVQIDGKDYGGDDPLPISKIPTEQLKRWKESGKIGTRIAEAGVGLEVIVKNANARNAVLEQEAAVKDARITELEKSIADKDVLLQDKDTQIGTLGQQIEELTKSNSGSKK